MGSCLHTFGNKRNKQWELWGLLIEYGAYVKDCDDYEREVFFINGENGLRYTEMTVEEFIRRMVQLNSGTGNIPFIKCNVNSVNTFFHLIERTFLVKTIQLILIYFHHYIDSKIKI